MKAEEEGLLRKIDLANLPRHVAVIMDGNGRWAKKRMMPRIFGHRAGVNTVDRILTLASEIKLKALTLYSFSTENWQRPPLEVKALMGILSESLMKQLMRMVENNIRLNTIGHIENLPEEVRECIEKVKESTKDNDGTILTLALSYGARDEIVDASRKLCTMVKNGELSPEEITADILGKQLDTADLPETDLLIRTSGELRISNFLLWQLAYSELYFTDVLWPDFSNADFLNAILCYQKRERRFGLAGEQIAEKKGARPKPAKTDVKKTTQAF